MGRGIIKNLSKKYCPYLDRTLSLDERFNSQERKSAEFAEMFFRVVKRETARDIIDYIKHPLKTTVDAFKVNSAKFDNTAFSINNFIDNFTNHDEVDEEKLTKIKNSIIGRVKQISDIVYQDRDRCKIILSDGNEISIKTISSAFPEIAKSCGDLTNSERHDKCHMRSLLISNMIKGNCYTVTGESWFFCDKAKGLHSWVEVELDDGRIYCLDNNINAIMDKADYYRVYHPKVFERISNKQVAEDIRILEYLNNRSTDETPYIKLYCTSRDEGIEKYNELIDLEDSIDSPQV